MKSFQRLKIQKTYNKQNEEAEKLIEKVFELYPQEIDISDGELRGKNGFWSKKLSDAFHNAEELNTPDSKEIDFMIWAVYSELHAKSLENFEKGIKIVKLSELSHIEISRRYIKSCLKADLY